MRSQGPVLMPVLDVVADDRRVARGEFLSHPRVLEAALPGTPDEIAKHRVERGRGERDQQGGFAIDAKIEQGRDLLLALLRGQTLLSTSLEQAHYSSIQFQSL